jgi:hypothetical protein
VGGTCGRILPGMCMNGAHTCRLWVCIHACTRRVIRGACKAHAHTSCTRARVHAPAPHRAREPPCTTTGPRTACLDPPAHPSPASWTGWTGPPPYRRHAAHGLLGPRAGTTLTMGSQGATCPRLHATSRQRQETDEGKPRKRERGMGVGGGGAHAKPPGRKRTHGGPSAPTARCAQQQQ